MLFQETTPDTSGYMIAGYAIAFIVMALYVISLILRSRNLNQDMATLKDVESSAVQIHAPSPSRTGKKPPKSATKKGRKK